MFLQQTHFELLSLQVGDDNGFPRIVLLFNTSDRAVVSLSDPFHQMLFSDTYYNGLHNESIYISNYRTTVVPGSYRLQAIDASQNTIFENELQFRGANLSLVSLSVGTWTQKSQSSIVTLHLLLQNSGDLPAYPHRITVQQGTSFGEALFLPTVVLPTDTTPVTCFLSLPENSADDGPLHISILDNAGIMLHHSDQTILAKHPTDSWQYQWYYRGHCMLEIPNVDWLFEYYQSLDRYNIVDYSAYVFDAFDDQYLGLLVDQILSLRDVTTDMEKINFVASFVQSIEYKNDDPANASYEYPRFPLETLKEKRGDCEDKAILTAALLRNLGYNVSLIRLPQHMALGVHLNETIPGYSYFIDQYYFLETTTLHMTLGRVPPEYQGLSNISVYPISNRPLLIHRWKSATRYQVSTGKDYVQVKMILENLGAAGTPKIEVQGAFYDGIGQIYNLQTTTVLPVAADEKRLAELSIDVPTTLVEKTTTLKTELYLNGVMVNQRESTSRFP